MPSENTIRIKDQPLDTELSVGDYVIVDNDNVSEGTRKFDLGSELRDIKEDLAALEGGGMSTEFKQALHNILEKVAYIDEDGQDYLNALDSAMYPPVTAISLNTNSLSFATLNSTQQLTATTTPVGGNVTWASSDTSVATVSSTGLVTSKGYGSATITATAGSVSATCSVAVTQATLSSISAVYTQSGTVYTSDSLDSLKSDLVVTAHWNNSTTSTVPSADYTLSGTLTAGTSTITVSYGGKTTTFNVTVTEVIPDYPKTITSSSDGVGFGSIDPTQPSKTPPYVANTGKSRIHCMGTDALGYPVTEGKSYNISITTTLHTEQPFVIEFNEDGFAQLQSVSAVSRGNYKEGDWETLTNDSFTYTPSTLNNKPAVAFWIGCRKDTSNRTWSDLDDSIFPLTITEVTS